MHAYMEQIIRGVHEYCNAYHHGPNRAEVVDIISRYSNVNDKNAIENMEWGARDPEARVFERSVMDIQDYYFQEKLTEKKFAFNDFVDDRYRAAAVQKVGPFKLAHDDGKPGCGSGSVASR
jgi:hypothetical protein